MSKVEMQDLFLQKIKGIKTQIKKAVKGKDLVIDKLLIAVLSGGHILLEDVPGVGKTTLAVAFSKATNMKYSRMQFTPDVLPSDVTGFNIYDKKTERFAFKAGPVFSNLFLADEINRTSPKTQSSLLEIMEENQVTIDGVTRELPVPFIVIATQNPVGYVGTQMLPESQLDRFAICISMGYPSVENEVCILKDKRECDPIEIIEAVASIDDLIAIKEEVKKVYCDDKILHYIANIAALTRNHPYFELGVSPRGSLALMKLARANAYINGRDFVTPDDVTAVIVDVFEHRLVLSSKAKQSGVSVKDGIDSVLGSVKLPLS